MEVIIIVVGVLVWAVGQYTKLDFYKKLVTKAVLAYVALGALGLGILALLVTSGGVIVVHYEDTIENRLDSYAWYCANGDFDSLSQAMYYDNSYEEEFDYLWEQVDMYDTYNQYQIFIKAAGAAKEPQKQEYYLTMAEECKQTLLAICRESTFEENVLYAEYYGTVVWE